MGIKSAKIVELIQRVDEDLLTDMKQHPSRVKRWFVNNIFRRCFSYLIAFTERNKAVRLRCTGDGKLKVASSGSGLTVYSVESGMAMDAFIGLHTYELDDPVSYIDILIETNDAILSIRDEGNVWGDEITLPVGTHEYHFTITGVRFRNRNAGNDADYEVVLMR